MRARATPGSWLIILRTGRSLPYTTLSLLYANARQDPRQLRVYPACSPKRAYSANTDTAQQPSSSHASKLGPFRSDTFHNARTIDRRVPPYLTARPDILLPGPRFPRRVFPREVETSALGL